MSKNKHYQPMGGSRRRAAAPLASNKGVSQGALGDASGKQKRKPLLLPIPIMVFLLVWLWASWWQGDVFRMVHENSFFAPDPLLMKFELDKSYGLLWTIGRALLSLFRYPWLGGAVLSLMLTASCWLLGYAMRLTSKWRWVQYLPLLAYTGIFTYQGVNNWFESESGHAMGIPFCILLILVVWGIIIRSFSKKPVPAFLCVPKDETKGQNLLQLAVAVFALLIPSVYGQVTKPEVRVLAKEQVAVMNQDWQKVIDVAHENAEISNRPMAAQYAIALVQTGQIADRLFDIRLDYDNIHALGFNRDTATTSSTTMYLMECDYHAGLVQTAYHHAMESMAMEGPTLRNLKMLCKTSLMRGEWEVAEKYLTILDKVPFEGDFVEKYRPMLRDSSKVNADPEMAMVRLTEPLFDNFENHFIQPTFLGYNTAIMHGRSINALWNSTMVCIYTKAMHDLLYRTQPMQGTTPPANIAEALALMSGKDARILEAFSGLTLYKSQLASFIDDTRQYMGSHEDRAAHARELFPKYKGSYAYYYFFGNLKATKRKEAKKESSNVGVN